jgi:hypothetical protein
MSVASLLQTLGIVTPVPPVKTAGVTEKPLLNQECSPCSPCYPEKQRRANKESERREEWQPGQPTNPDDLLADIAAMLQADPGQLRALLSADDIQDIADGENSRTYMLDYFRLMRADGKLPVCTELPAKASKPPLSHMESAKAWTPAHDRYISHVMACTDCRAPQRRYCHEGAQLRGEYWGIHQSNNTEESL